MNVDPKNLTSVTFSKVLDSFYVYTGDTTDKYVQKSCISQGVWDKELTEWMIKNIQPGWTCLDIGANVFYFTEVMARLVGSNGNVMAFEPIKRLCKSYEYARTLNEYDNAGKIEVLPFALSILITSSHVFGISRPNFCVLL